MHRTQGNRWSDLGLFAAAVLAVAPAWAIDCSKARTSTEKAICADPKLQALDYQLNRDYREFVKYHKATGHYDCLVEDEAKRQKQWLQQRDACGGDARCIQKAYQDRQAALNQYTVMCVGGDNMPQYAGRSCYKPDTTPTAPVASTASPTAPTASTESPANQQCSDTITEVPAKLIADLYSGADPVQVMVWRDELNAALKNPLVADQMNTKYKLAFFLGQTMAETSRGRDLTESLVYQAETAYKTWSYFKKHGNEAFVYGKVTKKFIEYLNLHPDEAKKKYGLDVINHPLTEKDVHGANQEAIANRAYANRKGSGNGDVASGDGWKYRGRGLIQLTFKGNYENLQKKMVQYKLIEDGDKVDITKDPDRVSGNQAMTAAVAYWVSTKIGSTVEGMQNQGKSISDINRAVTRSVNGAALHRLKVRLAETKSVLEKDFFRLCKDIEKKGKKLVMSFIRWVHLA